MYKLTESPYLVIRLADNAQIPLGIPYIIDAAEYMDWLADGNTPLPAFSADEILENLRKAKLDELSTACSAAEYAPVVHNLISWHGGYESAQKIKGKADMLEFAGQIEGEIFDVGDVYHTMPLADMRGVAYAIGLAYETALTNYKIKSNAVNAAATAEEISAVVW